MFVYTIRDVLAVAVVLAFAVYGLLRIFATSIRQWLCKHDKGYFENMACDAICRECGKNLGFVGGLKGANDNV